MIKFRFSIAVVIAFLIALTGASASTLFAIAGLAEILLIGIIIRPLMNGETFATDSWWAFIIKQYSDGDYIDPLEMLHMGGARVLGALLGFFGVFYYIPAFVVYLTTLIDIVPVTKKKKPRS